MRCLPRYPHSASSTPCSAFPCSLYHQDLLRRGSRNRPPMQQRGGLQQARRVPSASGMINLTLNLSPTCPKGPCSLTRGCYGAATLPSLTAVTLSAETHPLLAANHKPAKPKSLWNSANPTCYHHFQYSPSLSALLLTLHGSVEGEKLCPRWAARVDETHRHSKSLAARWCRL